MDKYVIGLVASAVILPILVGVSRGHVPKEVLKHWAFPLAAATFLLALGIQGAERYLSPPARLVLSIVFAASWIIGGVWIGFIQPMRNPQLPERVRQAMRTLGLIFLSFGILWTFLSVRSL